MAIHLLILAGTHAGQRIALPPTQFVIGRDDNCHLRPISMEVSKFHCAIAHHGDRIALRDLHSTNGTFLNGQRITGTARARHGDVLKIGPLAFMFQLERDWPPRGAKEDQLDWLMRSPTMQESQELDPDQDTAIIEMLPVNGAAENRSAAAATTSVPSYSKEATAVAGRFMREYMARRTRPKRISKGKDSKS